ncbi:ABC transporter permease [Streptomyces sp. VNUA24]|uniref:ABC transporter permease n=1 Tax=Streptomyces sp. VNUA24 TaxID=3031131 RepID=UPI0023B7AE9B|nr:ABC transporter permease [Streptomyces sp. VNUA24]WEH12855.1 ABC transporter permease [Streptomyces sp. VNUA24]
MNRLGHLAARTAVAATTLFAVLTFNFFLFRAAGDPKNDLLRKNITAEARRRLIHERGLDQDLFTQFVAYLKQLFHGDLGTSFRTGHTVSHDLLQALPNTLILVGVANLLAALAGIWLGVVAAARRHTRTDTAVTQGSLLFYSMPEYWLGMTLIGVFAVGLGLFPTGQRSDPGATFTTLGHVVDVAEHAVLPVLSLTLGLLGMYAVVMRASLSEVLDEDFVRTARAIGMVPRRVIRHATRNAVLPVMTLATLNLGFVVAGAVTVEAIFSWPGLGDLTYQAIQAKDYPVMQGVFLVIALVVIVLNLLTDLAYPLLDPRVRAER